MHINDFDFHLPKGCIAQYPVSPRDKAKMLHISTGGELTNSTVFQFTDYIQPGDLIIANNTKVIPARLYGKRGEAKIEIMLHKHEGKTLWNVFARPAKRLRIGDYIEFSDSFKARVCSKDQSGTVLIDFQVTEEAFWELIHKHGIMPLPPYIERDKEGKKSDIEDYQTLFAKHDGAVAAPTAGLHFTDRLVSSIHDKGAEICNVTLHVGAGTFLPVKVDNIKDHVMHSEFGIIEDDVVQKINETKARGNKVIAIGTTSLRILESAAKERNKIERFKGETNIFITPGYSFKIVDTLLTNFHLPKSTLFMLVSAFSSLETMHKAYEYAITNNYRFYSYGDACLLERDI